jgi:hypothetical protein
MSLTDRWGTIRLLVLMAVVVFCLPLPARSYVLMGEHVLDLTVKALGKADGLEVSQTLTIHAPPPAASLPETLRIRFPYDVRADAVGENYERHLVFSGGAALMAVNGRVQDNPPRYLRYLDILMAKPRPALVDHLRMLGVDVDVSSLGRLEDQYCYVVGARYPNEAVPQLWVAKDTFLPFRLLLPASALQPEQGPVEIRYRNWTFVEGIAYPMHVVMMQDHQIMQEVRVDRVTVNPVLTGNLFDMTSLRRQWSRPAGPEEENGAVSAPRLLPPPSE